MIHELKTWPGPFQAARSGAKPYEIRVADRRFTTGDILVLREWTPEARDYTGSFSLYVVTHMTEGGAWGLPSNLVVMGIRMVPILAVVPQSDLGRLVGQLAKLGLAKCTPDERHEVEAGASLLALEHEPEGEDGRPQMPPSRFRFN